MEKNVFKVPGGVGMGSGWGRVGEGLMTIVHVDATVEERGRGW